MKYLIAGLIIIILAVGGIWFFQAKKSAAPKQPDSSQNQPADTDTSQIPLASEPASTENTATTSTPQLKSQPKNMILETNYGKIEIALDYEAAPKTSANFAKLVQDGFYNNLTFHRIVPGFVIQGGDPKGDGTGGPGYTIPAEIKLLHKRGSIAMARLSDQVNPARDSSGSQFYICLQDLPDLDGAYTVFGQVTSGMDVVDKIAAVATDANDKPLQPVKIIKAYIAPGK